MAKILIVEDDKALSALIVDWLVGEKHVPEPVYEGPDGLERLKFYKYDVVILDGPCPESQVRRFVSSSETVAGKRHFLCLWVRKTFMKRRQGWTPEQMII